MKVVLEDGFIAFNVAFYESHLAKSCGAKWHPKTKKWRAKPTRIVAAAVSTKFAPEEIDPAISELIGPPVVVPPLAIDPNAVLTGTAPDGSPIKLRPRQLEGISKAWPYLGFALFWVMGTGKTLTTIALSMLRREHGLIDRLVIVCPTSIKGVWKKEFGRYCALPFDMFVMESGAKLPKFKEFPIMVVGVEALSQGGAADIAKEFIAGGKAMVVVDESSNIKNYDAGRTERCWELGEEAICRLILTGTNVTQGVQDLYAQMYFVDPTIIGEMSYFSFRNNYCVMGGFENKKVVGYTNLAYLFDRIRPFCDVIRKKDVKDLPPKQYQVRDIRATPVQIKACKDLARDMKAQIGSETITVQNALEALLRFQQIAGGHMPDGTPLGSNPKMTDLIALLGEFDGKAIIWARYLPEITAITAALEKEWPGSTVAITGVVPPAERQPMVDAFEASNKSRFLVVNQQTCGKGLTVIAATLSVYFSNTFSLEDREQSEDRNHRIGQLNMVTYVDLISNLKVDQLIMASLLQKKSLSQHVNAGLLSIDNLL